MSVRIGLVGSGFWAGEVHAPGLTAAPGVDLVSVYARDADAANRIASAHGAQGFTDYGEFLSTVEAVDFAVTPDAQAELALTAARAGKHLLLEKPIALDESSAAAIAAAAQVAGVASVVFFTARFQPEIEAWLGDVTPMPWSAGNARWITSAMSDPSAPWSASQWRQRWGGLWDIGPHALSLVLPILGPVTDVIAVPGPHQLAECILLHESGATSTLSVTIHAPAGVQIIDLTVWGDAGIATLPEQTIQPRVALGRAATALVTSIESATAHGCDAGFGAEVVRVLGRIQASLAASPATWAIPVNR